MKESSPVPACSVSVKPICQEKCQGPLIYQEGVTSEQRKMLIPLRNSIVFPKYMNSIKATLYRNTKKESKKGGGVYGLDAGLHLGEGHHNTRQTIQSASLSKHAHILSKSFS